MASAALSPNFYQHIFVISGFEFSWGLKRLMIKLNSSSLKHFWNIKTFIKSRILLQTFQFQISLKFHINAIMPGFQPKEKHFVRFISLLETILEYILPVFWLLRHSWLNNKENAETHMWSQLLRFKPGCFDLTVLARFL